MDSRQLWQLGDEGLLAGLRELQTQLCRVQGELLAFVGELVARNLAPGLGYASTERLLRDLLRISAGEAARRVRHAEAVTALPSVTGPALPVALPAVAEALATGAVGAEHVEVIHRTMSELPAEVAPEDREAAEQVLVEAAKELDPAAVAKLGRAIVARLDQDGRPPSEAEPRHPVNELRWLPRRDGAIDLKGRLGTEGAALLTAVLGPLAKPAPAVEGEPDLRSRAERHGDALVDVLRIAAASGDLPAEGGERPTIVVTVSLEALRAQLEHAAHADPTDCAAGSGPAAPAHGAARAEPVDQATLPGLGGLTDRAELAEQVDPALTDGVELAEQVDLALTDGVELAKQMDPAAQTRQAAPGDQRGLVEQIDRAELSGRAVLGGQEGLSGLLGQRAMALLGDGTVIDAGTARRLACDSAVIPIVLGSRSEPLDIGRKTRTVPAPMRRALVLRDGGGCAFPGCTAPARWCEAHHAVPWANGGPTALSNLVLLCGVHHRLVHHSGWQIVMRDGFPGFIPPAFLDPARRPRYNPIHRGLGTGILPKRSASTDPDLLEAAAAAEIPAQRSRPPTVITTKAQPN